MTPEASLPNNTQRRSATSPPGSQPLILSYEKQQLPCVPPDDLPLLAKVHMTDHSSLVGVHGHHASQRPRVLLSVVATTSPTSRFLCFFVQVFIWWN